MVKAEGGEAAFVRAVRISIPSCKDYLEARLIAANTIAHLAFDLAYTPDSIAFIRTLGSRWAPVGAANDPTNLNKNWVTNVLSALGLKRG